MSGALAPATVLPLVGAEVALVKVLWTSVAATFVVAVTFSCAILFLVRLSEMRAVHRRGASALYGALSVCALAVFSATVVYGLILLTQKS